MWIYAIWCATVDVSAELRIHNEVGGGESEARGSICTHRGMGKLAPIILEQMHRLLLWYEIREETDS